jgi:hypothetical protein
VYVHVYTECDIYVVKNVFSMSHTQNMFKDKLCKTYEFIEGRRGRSEGGVYQFFPTSLAQTRPEGGEQGEQRPTLRCSALPWTYSERRLAKSCRHVTLKTFRLCYNFHLRYMTFWRLGWKLRRFGRRGRHRRLRDSPANPNPNLNLLLLLRPRNDKAPISARKRAEKRPSQPRLHSIPKEQSFSWT